jgi:hypothetical protein
MKSSLSLSIFFDRTIDRYPQIRESILQSCEVSDVINILVATGYRSSRKEFKRYIKYNCLDKGLTIVSLGIPAWIFSRHTTINNVYYENIQTKITEQFFTWLTRVTDCNGSLTSMFNATSSNSQFHFSFMASANTHYVPPHHATTEGWLNVGYTIQSKLQMDRSLSDPWTQTQDNMIRLPIRSDDVTLRHTQIEEIITLMCKYMSMDVFEFASIFSKQMIEQDSWRFDATDLAEEVDNISYEF